eukprot:6107762-Amphidinium_carterae.2
MAMIKLIITKQTCPFLAKASSLSWNPTHNTCAIILIGIFLRLIEALMIVSCQAESSSAKLDRSSAVESQPQVLLKEQRKKRKQCGGAWRAFVHVHLRGQQAAPEDFATLAKQYHALTPERKSYYQSLGLAANIAHKEGKSTFPCHSLRAAQSR